MKGITMRFNGVKQHDIRDCGAACLATVCLYYGLKVPLVTLREQMQVDKDGANLFAITETAEKYHLESNALHGSWSELVAGIAKKEFKLPIIAHVILEDALTHYVVILKVQSGKIYLFDPAKGHVVYPENKFRALWTGYIVTFERKKDFRATNLRKGYFRKFSVIVTKQKSFFAGVVLMSLLLSGVSIVSALAYRGVIDHFIMKSGSASLQITLPFLPPTSPIKQQLDELLSNINGLFGALVVLCLIQVTLHLLRGIYLNKISKKSLELLMSAYFTHVLLLPLRFFLDRETGEILSRFKDIEEIQSIISNSVLTLVLDSFMLIAGAIVLLSIDTALFLLILLIIGAYAIVVVAYRKTIANVNREVMESDAVVTSKLKEILDGTETIKTMNKEKYFFKKVEKEAARYISKIYKSNLIGISQGAILLVVNSIGVTCVLWLGSKFVIEGIITLGSLIAFVTLIQFFISPAQRLIGLQPEIQQAIIAAERLNDVLEVPKEKENLRIENDSPKISLKQKPIVFNDVSFSYGYKEPVLKNLSFTIRPGEKVAIVGPNGCGKTTVLHLLDAFYKSFSGEISIGEMSIKALSTEHIRNNISYVSQNTILFTGSIKENIMLGAKNCTEYEIENVIKNCRIEEIAAKTPFGLNSSIQESGKNLSGGQCQKIAIARTLLSNPDILLFDECTSQIDTTTENMIVEYITHRYSDCICIFVAHRNNIIKRCDRVLFIKNGTLAAFDSHEFLMANNLEYRAFIDGENLEGDGK
jgi:ATP-binding cassette subfamily B protein